MEPTATPTTRLVCFDPSCKEVWYVVEGTTGTRCPVCAMPVTIKAGVAFPDLDAPPSFAAVPRCTVERGHRQPCPNYPQTFILQDGAIIGGACLVARRYVAADIVENPDGRTQVEAHCELCRGRLPTDAYVGPLCGPCVLDPDRVKKMAAAHAAASDPATTANDGIERSERLADRVALLPWRVSLVILFAMLCASLAALLRRC